ncbi:MAG: MMPL family transporter [Bacteroidales bacterium]
MGGFFSIWYEYSRKNKWLFSLLVVLVIAVLVFLAGRLRFTEDIFKVVPANEKVEQFSRLFSHSAFSDQLVVFITAAGDTNASPEELIRFSREWAETVRIQLMPAYVSTVRLDVTDTAARQVYDEFYNNLPIFLDEEDFRRMESLTDPEHIREAMRKNYRSLLTPAGFSMKDYITRDPLGLTAPALEKLNALQEDESYRIYQGYLFSADLKHLMIFLKPAHPGTETRENAVMLKKLEEITENIMANHSPAIKTGWFGTAAVSVGNASQIQRDIYLTVGLAMIFLFLFITIYFRNGLVFLAIFLPAVLGGAFSLAMLFLFKGEISAISLGFGAVLLGISIDYALHFLNHVRDEGDVRTTIRDLSKPIILSSLTTAGAFFSLLLVRSEAIRDLGFFAGCSALGAAVFTLVILPQLAHLFTRKLPRYSFISRGIRKLASSKPENNRYLRSGILLLTIILIFFAGKVKFESDMSRMSYVSDELQENEAVLDRISEYTLRSVYVMSSGENLDGAIRSKEILQTEINSLMEEGLVKKEFSAINLLVPEAVQQERIVRWNAFWEDRKELVKDVIEQEAAALGFKQNTFNDFYAWLDREFEPKAISEFEILGKTILEPFLITDSNLTAVVTILKVKQEDKPAVYNRLENQDNIFVFDKQFLTSTFIRLLSEDFNRLVILSLSLVFLILLLSFGRIELAIITFIPLFISWIWTLGLMALLGIKLNIFNIVITSFVFGLGIDYGIFTMQGLQQQYQFGRNTLHSYRASIILAAITTLAGLGALIFARHPAMNSMAQAAIVGVFSVWLITWVMAPVLFRWLVYMKDRKRPVPVTFLDFCFSIQSLLIFIIGNILLLIYGIIVFKLLRAKKGILKDWFHYGMMLSTRGLIYSNFISPKAIINRDPKDLRKPAVLIANHQSHVDIALMLMLHPKLLELTNDRVQGNRFFGPLVRMAEFFAVSEGMESLAPKLRENFEQGYSVLIFPEGTRSPDGRIQRFHKGAFYLARELKTDILPVIIHGSGHAYSKGEYFLRVGKATIKFLPRIKYDDARLGEDLLDVSRNFRRYMADEYRKVAQMAETPEYFRGRLIKNYIYRGPVLEWYLRIKLRLENNYTLFHENLPKEGLITDIGCGYGFMAYMLAFLSSGRKITGIDYDRDKIETASHCPAKTDRLHFICGDALEMTLPKSRAFILADVLHYFPEEEQERLLINCVDKLEEGGVIIIRDADRKMKGKHLGTKISEFFSTRIGFNQTRKGSRKLYFTSREKILDIMERKGMKVTIVDETKMTSNLVYICQRKEKSEKRKEKSE